MKEKKLEELTDEQHIARYREDVRRGALPWNEDAAVALRLLDAATKRVFDLEIITHRLLATGRHMLTVLREQGRLRVDYVYNWSSRHHTALQLLLTALSSVSTDPATPSVPAKVMTFEEAWKQKEAKGYQYGKDALEQVRFGWDIAVEAGAVPTKDPLAEQLWQQLKTLAELVTTYGKNRDPRITWAEVYRAAVDAVTPEIRATIEGELANLEKGKR